MLDTARHRLLGWRCGRVSWRPGQGSCPSARPARGGLRMAGQREEPDVTFNFNSELYADPNIAEGVDYARRHRRHERFDDTLARTEEGSSPAPRSSAWPSPATTRPTCPRSRPPR